MTTSMPASATVLSMRKGEYLLLEAELPGRGLETIGVLLYDPEEHRLQPRLRRDWDRIAQDDEAEVLEMLAADLEDKIAEFGAEDFLGWLEGTLSDTVRLSERRPVAVGGFTGTLNRLYREHVPSTVQRFQTHLPVYSLRAAAGRWGEHMEEQAEPSEADDWLETPPGLRLTDGMFVAQVVGQSMEPLIPDGSWCVFRAPVVGSREGKRVLVANRNESESGGQRYTIKRYRSHKIQRDDGTWNTAGFASSRSIRTSRPGRSARGTASKCLPSSLACWNDRLPCLCLPARHPVNARQLRKRSRVLRLLRDRGVELLNRAVVCSLRGIDRSEVDVCRHEVWSISSACGSI